MITRRQWMGLTLGTAAVGLDLEAALPVPRRAPELAVMLNSKEQLLLSKFRGKLVALEFLLTTCPHCQRCSGIIEKMYKEFGPRGFQPIGAAINDNAQVLVPEFIIKLGLTYPVGVTPREMAYDFLGYNPSDPNSPNLLMPQLVFIDRKGIVRAQYPGDDNFFKEAEETNMRNQIEALLKDAGATKSASSKKPAAK
ncbi:MAG: TlpA disulfide reductase family protein [Bryobacteraceae bacterium]